MPEFDPGYVHEPFRSLVEDYPTETVYPESDFRTEWGRIFHRGRLDGSARVLVIGQDPGQHENVIRRILVGEAGRRVQGFLGRLGITNFLRSYQRPPVLCLRRNGKPVRGQAGGAGLP